MISVIERSNLAVTSLLSVLGETEQLISLAVELAKDYAHLYALLSSIVDEAFMRNIERMKKEGKLSIPGEDERFIPLMLLSTQEDEVLLSSVKQVFERKKVEGKPFYYLFFPEPGEDLESGEKLVKLMSSILLNKSGLNAVLILLRSFKMMPMGDAAVVINELTTIDRHNIVNSLLSSGVRVILDNETFGGGPIAYCIHVFVKRGGQRVSFLDMSLPESMINDVTERLVSAVEDALEKAGDQS
ncbi:MAG: hypothetical protein KIH04_10250 [Candidatus Freyarchaeota archaeon]|nr:hypothetical protein [Candidatus Jordarchaeia archaeon]